jgi:DNA-binding NarL/FixJ family response regulator
MGDNKTVLIIDDHPLFREGLKAIISRSSLFKVVGEAGSARQGFELAKKNRPDLILVDISLPDKSGIELSREIRSSLPDTKIMIISMHSKADYIAEAFQAGATGYLAKESASVGLLKGLELVLKGEYFLDTCLSQEVVRRLMESPVREKKITDASYSSLTNREQEVMRLLAEGISRKEIAEKLFISPKTVENHRTNIMNKLDLHSTMELIRYAARLGIIDVDLWKE